MDSGSGARTSRQYVMALQFVGFRCCSEEYLGLCFTVAFHDISNVNAFIQLGGGGRLNMHLSSEEIHPAKPWL